MPGEEEGVWLIQSKERDISLTPYCIRIVVVPPSLFNVGNQQVQMFRGCAPISSFYVKTDIVALT